VGVDLERIQPCDTAFADLICTTTERRDPACVTDPDHYLTSIWCSKEALAKALGDARRYEPSRIDSPLTWPYRAKSLWQTTELAVAPGFVAWLCWETSGADPRRAIR
jgi:phosphopantetheinyl transferase